MGLFDTKYCSICGNKVGLLGGTKLDDGYLCKDCTAKLSPYFSRRHQTVDTIRKHLAYREANAKALSSLQISGNYGDSQKIWIDSANRRFVIARTSDFARTNPDIFSFNDVITIEKVLKEEQEEQKTKDAQGNEISYNPPRFEYSTSYHVHMSVRNADIADDIRIELYREKTSGTYHDDEFFRYNELTNEAINTIKPGAISEETFREQETETPADTPRRYVCYIRCRNCGALIEGPAIPRFCPECADAITLEDIGVIDTETGDILV